MEPAASVVGAMQPSGSRLCDSFGYRLRAACICFDKADLNSVLLVSSTSKNGRSILPAGGLEEGEALHVAARREAHEEAGVLGRVFPIACVHDHDKRYRTSVFAMIVDNVLSTGYADAGKRTRAWMTIEQAVAELRLLPAQLCAFLAGLHSLAVRTGYCAGLRGLQCSPALIQSAICGLAGLQEEGAFVAGQACCSQRGGGHGGSSEDPCLQGETGTDIERTVSLQSVISSTSRRNSDRSSHPVLQGSGSAEPQASEGLRAGPRAASTHAEPPHYSVRGSMTVTAAAESIEFVHCPNAEPCTHGTSSPCTSTKTSCCFPQDLTPVLATMWASDSL